MGRTTQFRDYLLGRIVLRTALLLLVLVFGFLAVDNWVVRWDLTEDERFSISPASHRIAASLEDPLTIRAYFSGRIPEWIQPMQRQVFDILAEYEAHGHGKIKVERYDPLESASAKSEAASYGVRESQIAVREATGVSAQQVYGSIVLLYGDRAPQVINIAERYPEGYDGLSVLESELSGKIWELSHEKAKIGFTGYLEREGRGNPMMGQQQPRPEFNELRSKLGSGFEIEDVDLDREDLDPKKVPLLLVIRPKEFTDVAVFRLDQYLMKGGRVLLFVTEGVLDQGWDGRFTFEPFKTGLDGWLEHHGVRVPNEFVLQLFNTNEIRVPQTVPELGNMQVSVPVPNWFWPIFGLDEAYDRDNPAVQKLKSVDLYWPHPVDVLENRLEGRKATVLIRSHAAESWRWKDLHRVDMRSLNPESDGPSRSDLMSSPVVVALDGSFTSYYAERPVPPSIAAKKEGEGHGEGDPAEASGDEGEKPKGDASGEETPAGGGKPAEGEGAAEGEKPPEGEKPAAEEKPPEEKPDPAGQKPAGPEVVRRTETPTQLVVVGNSIFVSDIVLGGRGERAEVTASLALNLVNWLAGSADLIALRAKRYMNRTLVDKKLDESVAALRKEAEAGEIDEASFRRRIDELSQQRKAREKRSRWINIVLPILFIWVSGAVVWVVRAANRSGPARIPPPTPPQSLKDGGSDS